MAELSDFASAAVDPLAYRMKIISVGTAVQKPAPLPNPPWPLVRMPWDVVAKLYRALRRLAVGGSFDNLLARPNAERGSLIVVGTGIRSVGQLTIEAIAWMQSANRVFHLAGDPVVDELIDAWHVQGRRSSLTTRYEVDRRRGDTYADIVEEIRLAVVAGETVCLALYGHPAVLATPTHDLVRRLRSENYVAQVLPGISADACLYADLLIDPGDGCVSYDATDFVRFDRPCDNASHLILWQVGALGDWSHQATYDASPNLLSLVERLTSSGYTLDADICLYEAATTVGGDFQANWMKLGDLHLQTLTAATTLYVEPVSVPEQPRDLPRMVGKTL